jgi:hypothetical protein
MSGVPPSGSSYRALFAANRNVISERLKTISAAENSSQRDGRKLNVDTDSTKNTSSLQSASSQQTTGRKK